MPSWRDLIWNNAAGDNIPADVIVREIKEHIDAGGRIFIGCDSNVVGTCCTYATAIVLYNDRARRGGRYFFTRTRTQIPFRSPLRVRLMAEADMSILLGIELQDEFPEARIEIHLDVSQRKENMSNGVADQVTGYARAAGFEYKLKPESWASSCVADEHTR